jgi:hypothetical protein
VEVFSSEEDVPKPIALADKKKVGDDTEDGGASSVELIAPNPIRSDMLRQVDSSVVDQATVLVAPTSRHGHKHSAPIPKRKQTLSSAEQVMTQIELPPYCGPWSPPYLVAIEIIFRRLFKVFQYTSQAAGIGTSVGDNAHPHKKMRQSSLKRIPVAR